MKICRKNTGIAEKEEAYMLTKKLSNGVEIPMLGFGVYQVTDQETCERSVLDAIDVGYRLFDTAWIYGNEQAVGNAIKNCKVPREELFITSKVWTKDIGYDLTRKALEASLDKLQTDYLDLYLALRQDDPKTGHRRPRSAKTK